MFGLLPSKTAKTNRIEKLSTTRGKSLMKNQSGWDKSTQQNLISSIESIPSIKPCSHPIVNNNTD